MNLLFAIVVAAAPAMAMECKPSAQSRPHEFFLARGAKDVRYTLCVAGDQKENQLNYKLDRKFPSETTIQEIKTKLAANGWEALKDDFLNPGTHSSIVRGWMQYDDETTKPAVWVHLWIADWQNKAGDVVRYAFEYRSPIPAPGQSDTSHLVKLEVTALYLTADVARKAREEGLANTKALEEQIRQENRRGTEK